MSLSTKSILKRKCSNTTQSIIINNIKNPKTTEIDDLTFTSTIHIHSISLSGYQL